MNLFVSFWQMTGNLTNNIPLKISYTCGYKNKYNLHEPWRISEYKNDLKEFNSNDLSKTFSFFYRWVTFKKV